MLQQTQAPRVEPAFEAFVARYPDVASLAAARRDDVVRAWSGLGYNRRAVALHRAARAIVADHEGVIPSDPAALRRLPGVGPYTAAAVASIAYGRRVAALDTNARRITARLDAGVEPPELAAGDLAQAAADWVHPRRPGDWNQALMDLGREVCRPEPQCDRCPLAPWCRFRAAGRPAGRRATSRPLNQGAPRQKGAFVGSRRQARGAIVERLRRSSTPVAALPAATGLDRRRVEDALATLEADGLVAIRRGRASLAR